MAQISLTQRGPEDGGNCEYGWSDGYLDTHIISDVGKKRQHNEDSSLLCAPEDESLTNQIGVLVAVADGMGGASAGEMASQLTLTEYSQQLYASEEGNVPSRIRGSVEHANERVFEEARKNPAFHGMGTTLSAMSIVGDIAYIGHVGDSRVYVLRKGEDLVQITQDHSLVAEQLRSGMINEEEARNHSLKNLITRAVGIKEAVQTDVFCARLQEHDTLLICSDGLTNMVEDATIAEALSMDTLQGAARILVGKALEAGGVDNITVALVRVSGRPPRTEVQEGCEVVELASAGLIEKIKRLLT